MAELGGHDGELRQPIGEDLRAGGLGGVVGRHGRILLDRGEATPRIEPGLLPFGNTHLH